MNHPDFDTAKRMIDILTELAGRTIPWPLADISEEYGVNQRTIKRYVDAFSEWFQDETGEPMIFRSKGRLPAVHVKRPVLSFNPWVFDYASLFFAMRILDFAGADSFQLQSMRDSLKPRVNDKWTKVIQRFPQKFFVYHAGIHRKPDTDIMDDMIAGLVYEHRLSLRYGNWPKAKTVEPLTLAVYKEGLYLIVKMPGKPNPFILSVPHIKEVKRLQGQHFDVPKNWDPAGFRDDRFGLMPGKRITVSLRFLPHMRPYVESRVIHPSQEIEVIDKKGTTRVTMKLTAGPEFVSWLASCGPDVYVEKPAGLRKELQEKLAKTLAQY